MSVMEKSDTLNRLEFLKQGDVLSVAVFVTYCPC